MLGGWADGCLADEVGVDAVEHQFGAAEHGEAVVGFEVAPGEVEESFTADVVHGGATKVEVAVGEIDGADLEVPVCTIGVGGDQVVGLVADLYADVDVGQGGAVGLTVVSAVKVVAGDDDLHGAGFASGAAADRQLLVDWLVRDRMQASARRMRVA